MLSADQHDWSNGAVITRAQDVAERRDERRPSFRRKRVEIPLPPPDRWQVGGLGQVYERPIRFALFEADQKPTMRLRHLRDHRLDERLASGHERLQRDGIGRHALKPALEFPSDVLARGREHLSHRSAMAHHLDEEGAAQLVAHPFIGEKLTNVEEIAWVLTVSAATILPA